MLDLLDCLMPACHEASAVTTPILAGLTFVAVIALAVTGHRLASSSVGQLDRPPQAATSGEPHGRARIERRRRASRLRRWPGRRGPDLGGDNPGAPAPDTALAALLPGARPVELPRAGHLPTLERPQELSAMLTAFLRDIVPAG